jgi:hypothetical protein
MQHFLAFFGLLDSVVSPIDLLLDATGSSKISFAFALRNGVTATGRAAKSGARYWDRWYRNRGDDSAGRLPFAREVTP